jgi:hypothetical protein
MKKFFVTVTDIMVLSISIVFFITMFMTGELLIMFVMGIFIIATLYAYWRSRKKYLYGCCC